MLVEQARRRARRELDVGHPLLFLIWGLSTFACYGVLWLAVRGQHPYHTLFVSGAGAVMFVLALFGALARLVVVDRALEGVGGRLPRQWAVFFASAAVNLDWSNLALGGWLLALAAVGAQTGPVTILAIYAVAGGGAFLAIAAMRRRQRRR